VTRLVYSPKLLLFAGCSARLDISATIKQLKFVPQCCRKLNSTYLRQMQIDMLPGFVDPYRERTLTRGEIGCFLSHYFIWKEVTALSGKLRAVCSDFGF